MTLEARHFPVLGPESLLAAQAAECAREQGRFWEYYDLLFARQKGRNQGAYAPRNLKTWAGELGLDRAQFDACLDGGQAAARVEADVMEAQRLGLQYTPSFLIGDTLVEGLLPWDRFRPMVEDALRKKGLRP